MSDTQDVPVTPPKNEVAAPPESAPPIFKGAASLWLGYKSFLLGALLGLGGLGVALWGLTLADVMRTVCITGGLALALACGIMILYVVLCVRTLRYTITRRLIEREQGLFVRSVDALDLSRVKDVELRQSLRQRMANTGTIVVFSTDKTDPVMLIEEIPNPRPAYEKLRDAVIEISQKRGVVVM